MEDTVSESVGDCTGASGSIIKQFDTIDRDKTPIQGNYIGEVRRFGDGPELVCVGVSDQWPIPTNAWRRTYFFRLATQTEIDNEKIWTQSPTYKKLMAEYKTLTAKGVAPRLALYMVMGVAEDILKDKSTEKV